MKTLKHINLEQRKLISSGISHNKKLIEIAEDLSLNPRGISKKVRINRITTEPSINTNPNCPKLNR